jgi:type VI secretion system protein ImpK
MARALPSAPRSTRRPRAAAKTKRHEASDAAEQINAIVRPFLITISELQQLGPERRPPAEVAHKEVRQFLEETMDKADELGLPPEDQQDLRFALVAFADEMMQRPPGRFQEFWTSHLLQEAFFDQSLAGETFYQRLAEVRADTRRHGVLLVYYLCMLFGYRGKYRDSSELAFENLLDDVRGDLQQSMGLHDPVELAPAGDRPNELAVDGRRNLLLQSLAVTVAVLSLLLYVGLWLVIDDEAADVLETLRDEQRQLMN